jgi:predicted Fe-Mo cluster-binding NifX family protein
VFELEGGKVTTQIVHELKGTSLSSRADFVADLGVSILICGAVSRHLDHYLRARGIVVVPWVAGRIVEVKDAYLDGRLSNPRFLMPGCRRVRSRHRYGRGWGRPSGRYTPSMKGVKQK